MTELRDKSLGKNKMKTLKIDNTKIMKAFD
jgi:hypothetical protein